MRDYCNHCGQRIDTFCDESPDYCSEGCRVKDSVEPSEFAQRMYDGGRMQSDDFGERDFDDSVTYHEEEDKDGF